MILMRMKARETAAVSGHGTPVHCLMMVPQEAVRHTANQLGSLRRGLADKSSYADVQTLLGKVRIWHRFSDFGIQGFGFCGEIVGVARYTMPCVDALGALSAAPDDASPWCSMARPADKSSYADMQTLLGKVLLMLCLCHLISPRRLEQIYHFLPSLLHAAAWRCGGGTLRHALF